MRSLRFQRIAVISLMSAALTFALSAQSSDTATPEQSGFRRAEEPAAPAHNAVDYVVPEGTHILLSMINSVSTKQAAVGDRIYLETAFPILANGQIVIPQGSWVEGTLTQVKRPGRVKGRGQLYVQFDSLTLPNGVSRDFRARIGAMDGRSTEQVNKDEGKITSAGNKGGDAATIAQSAGAAAGIGTLIGAAAGHYGMGAGIGGAAGAAAGLAGVLLSRGPDATLTKGTTMEMVLDRPLTFTQPEIDFRNAAPRPPMSDSGSGPEQPQQNKRRWTPWPF